VIRFICAIHQRPDISFAEFSRYWQTTHADIVLEFADPGPLLGYVQNERLADAIDGIASDFDGAPDLWIRDSDAFGELMAAPRFQYAVDVDSPEFVQMPAIAFIIEEAVLHGPEDCAAMPGTVKLMLFFRRPDGADAPSFDEAWSTAQQSLLMPRAQPLRLARALVQTPDGTPEASGFHGVESSWWPDVNALAEAWSDRQDMAGVSYARLVAQERIMLAPPG